MPTTVSTKAAEMIARLALTSFIALAFLDQRVSAQESIDAVSYFKRLFDAGQTGLARKTKLVDVQPAKAGQIVATIIAGEGKETQSPPATTGDMVVRNRCPETGNEQILVSSAKFSERYEGPIAASGQDGWRPYRPRGVQMRYAVVSDGEFAFIAPWGEKMIARPGDAIMQDPKNPRDTYRIAKAAFACTYEIIRHPQIDR